MNDQKHNFSIEKLTAWIGSVQSLFVHTILFCVSFVIAFLGLASWDRVLLVVTTIVSLEAIYLAIFIQMTVNRHARELEEVSEDVEDIQEDIEEISEDVEGLQEGIEEMNEEDEHLEEHHERDKHHALAFEKFAADMKKLLADLEYLNKNKP